MLKMLLHLPQTILSILRIVNDERIMYHVVPMYSSIIVVAAIRGGWTLIIHGRTFGS